MMDVDRRRDLRDRPSGRSGRPDVKNARPESRNRNDCLAWCKRVFGLREICFEGSFGFPKTCQEASHTYEDLQVHGDHLENFLNFPHGFTVNRVVRCT